MVLFVSISACSLALWGVWLVSDILDVSPEFDGNAFLLVAIASSQLIMLGNRYLTNSSIKVLLSIQTLINAVYPTLAFLDLNQEIARNTLTFITIGQLTAAYMIVIKLERGRINSSSNRC